jgi:asparagine synthase (glutamine-hydrolysing)
MCGINGIYAYGDTAPVDRRTLRRTRDFMAARGPDGFGEWYSSDGRVGLGHRRLSIIDLSDRGSQPMRSADGKVVVTFNGEIYNYRALRKDLEAAGCEFRSESDTEVLIHLYRKRGLSMVTALRGMFAFGLWDAEKQKLFLARDPYGIKPLYYADNGRTIQFASSVKSLVAGGQISREPDAAGVVGFYLFGSVPEPFTIYRAIRSAPAGSILVIDGKAPHEPKPYFSIANAYSGAEARGDHAPEAEVQGLFRDALLDSVRHHLIADVSVGAFLSGGVDSGALIGLTRDAGQEEIRTVTLAFKEFAGTGLDEAPLAERVANHYGTRHTTRWVDAAEFHRDLPAIMAAMDQPSIDGINTWFVSKAARELGLKVALSGIGGDELLGGYNTFRRLPRYVGMLGPVSRISALGMMVKHAVRIARAMRVNIHPKIASLLTYGGSFAGAYLLQRGLFLPSELRAVVHDEVMVREGLSRLDPVAHIEATLRSGPSSDFGRVATLESCFYLRNQLLRDTDWAGMAHSLEIRTPLVDSELLCRVASITANSSRLNGKTLLASSPTTALPSEIVDRAKTGFAIPVRPWARETGLDATSAVYPENDARLWSRSWAQQVMATHEMDFKVIRRERSSCFAGTLDDQMIAALNSSISNSAALKRNDFPAA